MSVTVLLQPALTHFLAAVMSVTVLLISLMVEHLWIADRLSALPP